MDTKVILMIFGVILVLSAIFFFFKSFASHEQRMQEEQRARLEMERKKLAADRAAANRPLTPEEIEQKRRLQEAREKAQAARRAAAEAARAEAKRKALQMDIERQKQRAEAEKKAAEEARSAEELRQKQAEVARKQAEEARAKAQAEAEARRAAELKRQGQAALGELKTWMGSVVQQSATAYPVKAPVPLAQGVGSSRFYSFAATGTGSTYNSPDAIPGFSSWPGDMTAAFCKKAMMDHGARQEPQAKAPAVFAKIDTMDDVEGLKELHRGLAAQVFKAQDAVSSAQKNQAAHRNLVAMGLRAYDKLNRQEEELERRPTNTRTTNSRSIGTKAPSKQQLLTSIRDEKNKEASKMQTQIVSYWKAMSQARGAAASVKLLNEAKRLVASRLTALGVENFGKAATATASTSKKGSAYKIYVMQDGTEIKAYTVMKMGDQLAIKDETGALKTVNAADVKEIKKP